MNRIILKEPKLQGNRRQKMRKLLRRVPVVFVYLIYFIASSLAELLLLISRPLGKKYQWTRNSLRLKRIEPFLSDIDFTLFFAECLTKTQIHEDFLAYMKIRKFIPLLGELNIYPLSWQPLTLRNMNPLELDRDPVLKYRLAKTYRPRTTGSDYVFLLRNLISDQTNLKQLPQTRLKKWAGHFADLNLPFAPEKLSFSYVLQTCLGLIFRDSEELDEKTKVFTAYFLLRDQEAPPLQLDEMAQGDLWLLSSFCPRHCYLQESFAYANEKQKEIISEQIRWEIFGALTQSLTETPLKVSSFSLHLERLRWIAEKLQLDPQLILDLEDAKAQMMRPPSDLV